MRPPKQFHPGRSSPRPEPSKLSRMLGQQPMRYSQGICLGDWGDLDQEDRSLNDAAVIDGSRILRAYTTRKGRSASGSSRKRQTIEDTDS